MIEVRELSYEYPGLRALSDVSFEIAPGTITALVGPNGAGKTTLLRCLAGMERPLSGSVMVNGIDVVEEPRRSHRHLGYLSDFFGLYDPLTVRQCLSYVGAANGLAPHVLAQTVVATATELGLAERLDQRTGELSRGLRQRVAIAQAIIHAPTVVLLDEPASGLDPEARFALGDLFLALRQRGMTLLVSSHILAELEAYSTHMLILRGGRLVEHRALASSGEAATHMEVQALQGSAALKAALQQHPAVSALRIDGLTVRFALQGAAPERAALLQSLLADGLSISHFAAVTEDLQQSYIHSLSRGQEA
jgi:ABC-2 type transport system ATP-binding protein